MWRTRCGQVNQGDTLLVILCYEVNLDCNLAGELDPLVCRRSGRPLHATPCPSPFLLLFVQLSRDGYLI